MLLAVIQGFGPQARASVVIAGTRVVYNQSDSEVTVKLTNNGKLPGLTKVWIDNGDADAKPDTIDVPFTITPPMMRIDPGKSQTLRIMSTGEPLPGNNESVLYLNVLEVPPKPTGDEASANQLQLAFRTRIKFFYRPAGLKGQASDAPQSIVWHLKREGGKNALVADNPTQYHVSFDRVELTDGAHTALFTDGGMVRPGQSETFPLKGELPAAGAKVRYTAINDYGGPQTGDATLAP
ncbi:fimbria/pilus periplasmic chaperone [Caballeronia sp. LZ062]|uniref:fimbria/pilus periplasmic chaperone n=1 Tax=unclassified Caballeronia TaxID=2646786 RepID=UPI002856E069|nr:MULTISPECIES: fimbria/pilus periplasmic chaperone [unclassified Caballeronia]MDR5856699.1 fimbria/pilus periplasmic chaperone [Caballeronia sp. LZ050]MDR5869903.1 fimbria/pilus periplasmic chaperone [Caballeronia sp. LZ062]